MSDIRPPALRRDCSFRETAPLNSDAPQHQKTGQIKHERHIASFQVDRTNHSLQFPAESAQRLHYYLSLAVKPLHSDCHGTIRNTSNQCWYPVRQSAISSI